MPSVLGSTYVKDSITYRVVDGAHVVVRPEEPTVVALAKSEQTDVIVIDAPDDDPDAPPDDDPVEPCTAAPASKPRPFSLGGDATLQECAKKMQGMPASISAQFPGLVEAMANSLKDALPQDANSTPSNTVATEARTAGATEDCGPGGRLLNSQH